MSDLLHRVLEHEGFRDKPYQDHLGIWTIGHGLTWLSEGESKAIVASRLHEIGNRLTSEHEWLEQRPSVITDVLTEMCFQMGWTGCHNFKNMWAALESGDFEKAATEMLDSKWAKQTPARAKDLAQLVWKAGA